MSTTLYAYSLNEEEYHGEFATRDEALAEANVDLVNDGDEPGDEATVWTGEVVSAIDVLKASQWWAPRVIDHLDETLNDQISSDEEIITVKAGHEQALKDAFLKAIEEHCDTHRWGVKNTQKHVITIE